MAFFTSTASSNGAPPAWIQHVFNRDLAALRSSIDATVTEYESVRRSMMANRETISRRIAEAEAKLSVQRAEQAAEFADLRAAEANDVRDIEARMNALEQELAEVRQMHWTVREILHRDFEKENAAARNTISRLEGELHFLQQLPCLTVIEPSRDLGKDGGGDDDSGDDDDDDVIVCCIICTRPYSPPRRNIFVCRNGHSFCSDCNANPSLHRCPMCRLDLGTNPPIRNRLAEQLIRRYGQEAATVSAQQPEAVEREE